MADQQHLAILQQGIVIWDNWRKEHIGILPNLSEAGLSKADLSGAALHGADLSGATLHGADLSGASLVGADLSGADLSGANLRKADLVGADLVGADLVGADLVGANLSRAFLSGANLSGAALNEASLSKTDLSRATLNGSVLIGADLSRAILNEANLSEANLSGVDLSGAFLSGADLSGAFLSEAALIRADLSGAFLSEAALNSTNLSRANLSNANLSNANLSNANLSNANLSNANLSNANLSEAVLSEAVLSEAILNEMKIGRTILGNIDLQTVQGLETVQHMGPSSIGVDTLERSGGNIPEIFLRGTGVSDSFISYARSLVAHPIEYYSCFISYSRQDQKLAEQLHTDLQSKGIRCWFAPENLKIGDKFRQRIYESIHLYDKLLLLLSEHSVASPWVATEVESAMEKERQQKKPVLFPIKLDEAVMKTDQAWAADIRSTRHIGDFQNWKQHDHYQKAFNRLLRDLQPEKS